MLTLTDFIKRLRHGWKRVYDTVVMPGTVQIIDVTVGKTETYTVRCLDLNGKTISGYNSKGWSKKYTPVAPTITKLENNYNGIRMTLEQNCRCLRLQTLLQDLITAVGKGLRIQPRQVLPTQE